MEVVRNSKEWEMSADTETVIRHRFKEQLQDTKQ
jgi:hypothetical protein